MTRILRMEMKGFKSFAAKTEILFGNNFNCILGPNGSGKSNVLDSLCFVLGKAGAKGLRVEKSSNLIYNGGKTKKPAKEGEVSIWFDNKDRIFSSIDEDEVKITRIIKANGQGIYKINDTVSTRTQILDVLSLAHINPDGYNIILQGDIIRLIEMSSVDRRRIIEEIAGINIYEDKKNKALRELNRVEEKINEADIVLTERESYLKELKNDRDKAQKYKDLEEKRKRNKKTLLVENITKREEQLKKHQDSIEKNDDQMNGLQEKVDELRKVISERKKDIEAINKEIEEKGEKEQVKIHKLVEELKVKVALDKQRLQTLNTEIEKVNARLDELRTSHREIREKSTHLENKKIEVEKRIALRENEKERVNEKILDFKKKNNLDEESTADTRVDEIDKELEAIQDAMNNFRERQQNVLREKDKVEMQLQSIDDKLDQLSQLRTEHKKELDMLKTKKQEFKKATVELSKALSDSSDYASQLATARSKILSKQEEVAKLEAKKASIMESLAGSSAVKAILDMKKDDPGILGTVAELANAPAEYSSALEVAAGNKIRSIVVENDSVAAKCIRFLKEKRLGVATFLPLNKIRAPEINEQVRNIDGSGVKGLAYDLVSFKSKYDAVFRYVFGNTLIVDSIETARRVGIGKVRMATITGDIAEMSGAMQGGYRQQKAKGGVFGQDEINEQIKNAESELSDKQHVISVLEQKSNENEELISRLRHLKAELEGDIIKTEKSLHLDSEDSLLDDDEKKRLQQRNKELEDEIDSIQEEISMKNRDFAKLKIERQQLRDKISDLRNPAKLAELKSFDEKKMELSQEIIELQGELKHAIAEMETILGPEDRKIVDIIKQHEKEIDAFTKEKKDLQTSIHIDEAELKEKEQQESAFYEQFKELFAKRSRLSDDVNKSETAIVNKNSEIRSFEQKNNALRLELARIKAELSGFHEEDKDYHDIEPYTSKSRDVILRELREFEKMTAELGAVNMRALEIYDQVAEEYKLLQEKKEVLKKERGDVLVMMNQIDSKKKELFMRTFEALEANFKRIFSTLLVKGDASLVLENKEDPFEGGVEIKVRLSGTRFMDIRSLSGGEKTMTALAFLFAVQEYEPASFYVLDEVDAALDKKNSEKLAELVRGYCDHAQYVVISHNDGVISEADNLYGVSMNEHGMSKVTSLKLDEAKEQIKEEEVEA